MRSRPRAGADPYGHGLGTDAGPAMPPPGALPQDRLPGAEQALWLALCVAPDDGADITELMRASGMSRPTLYRHLAEHARAGRAIQVSRGRWRAHATPEPNDE